ncbi:MAG TPA: exodeoxyribonuclease VII large subunit [Gammaproteobacteria bacterium]|nr:exodeoxyribonuclease VII large subunit [Gammaproteobacteria bacterium]
MVRTKSLTLGLDAGAEIFSVSALNREVRQLIEDSLGLVWVEGEISNLARPSSGHLYFSLKDDKAQVRCAMFRQANRRLGFGVADGMQVLVRARVGLYEPRGDYQLIVEHMEEAGQGALRRRFEALKAKLAGEGLFDPARKRELPAIPARIGVITSPTGAALRDVLTSLKRRFPAVGVLIYPTSVQGSQAAAEIVAALERASQRADCDLLILTRGGGSLEDLWPFNEEIVARAVAAVPIPIIVGVGHETDFTIAEFAADLRAPTPSQAAELAVPQQSDWLERLLGIAGQLELVLRRRLRDDRKRLDTLEHRLGRAHPGVMLRSMVQRLDEFEGRFRRGIKATMAELASRIRLIERGLLALSPIATLERGYAIVTRQNDGELVTRSDAIASGDGIDVRLATGSLTATVDSTRTPESDD